MHATEQTVAGWETAKQALAATEPEDKCRAVEQLWQAVESGAWVPSDPGPPGLLPCGRPGRPALVAPGKLPGRGLGNACGRAALVHAIAHIEFNAVNLALDAALRFPGLPDSYYRDWLGVAVDETRHFRLLTVRLAELGHVYGDFPAHNGLWDMAECTAHDPQARMALVPRVLEARGLDVTPAMIERLRQAGDEATVACLEVILAEEERHVALGSRWFEYLCRERAMDPEETFKRLVEKYYRGRLRGPLNLDARRRAGFSETELRQLSAAAD